MAGLHCRRRLTRIARQGMRVDFTGKGRLRTLSSVFKSRKFDQFPEENATERPRWVYDTLPLW